MNTNKVSIIWFRNDLRVYDNAVLAAAVGASERVLPVYIFDPRQYGLAESGFAKTGGFRTRFLIESVADLRAALRNMGGDLLVMQGLPEDVLPQLCYTYGATAVYASKEAAPEEVAVERNLQQALAPMGVKWRAQCTATLTPRKELPFDVRHMPDVFTAFRQKVEPRLGKAATIPAPATILLPDMGDPGAIPDVATLTGMPEPKADPRAAIHFTGGATAAMQRLQDYIWNRDCLKNYFDTRNGLLGEDYSTKFSPWLALGCISPRTIYDEVQKYERQRIHNKSTYWLIFELLWRDFFRFYMEKYQERLFCAGGIKNKLPAPATDHKLLMQWVNGQTGVAFVDANMNELRLTGFMSNRGRQVTASYLVHDMKVNWLAGAAYFECALIDYDVCSNYGNWAYVAGVGADPRPDRYFNTEKQAATYDADARYRNLWLQTEKPLQTI
jgi:deoxyribodipyrimidine photo-lyase